MRAQPVYAAALTALLLGAVGVSQAQSATSACPAPVAVAHRGESALAPEETGPAIEAASRSGANVVEMDVRWTKSHVAVLFHDATVDRTTDGTGLVNSFWLWQIRQLDAGSWFSPGDTGTPPITLGEAFRLIQPHSGVLALPELKSPVTAAELAAFAKAIDSTGMTGRVVVHSFSATILDQFHTIAPNVPLALVTSGGASDPVTAAKAVGARYWLPYLGDLTQVRVDAAHAANIKVWPWTADTDVQWASLTEMGVDGILTNRASRYVGWAAARCG